MTRGERHRRRCHGDEQRRRSIPAARESLDMILLLVKRVHSHRFSRRRRLRSGTSSRSDKSGVTGYSRHRKQMNHREGGQPPRLASSAGRGGAGRREPRVEPGRRGGRVGASACHRRRRRCSRRDRGRAGPGRRVGAPRPTAARPRSSGRPWECPGQCVGGLDRLARRVCCSAKPERSSTSPWSASNSASSRSTIDAGRLEQGGLGPGQVVAELGGGGDRRRLVGLAEGDDVLGQRHDLGRPSRTGDGLGESPRRPPAALSSQRRRVVGHVGQGRLVRSGSLVGLAGETSRLPRRS